MVHVPLMFLSEWREFPSAPCLAGKKKLMKLRVSMSLKSRASPDMLPFSLCNKKELEIGHMNRPLFPTTLSIPLVDCCVLKGLNDVMFCCVVGIIIRRRTTCEKSPGIGIFRNCRNVSAEQTCPSTVGCWRLYTEVYYLFFKYYYSPLHVSSIKYSSSGGHSCT